MTLAPLLLVTLALAAVVQEAAALPSFSGTFQYYHCLRSRPIYRNVGRMYVCTYTSAKALIALTAISDS